MLFPVLILSQLVLGFGICFNRLNISDVATLLSIAAPLGIGTSTVLMAFLLGTSGIVNSVVDAAIGIVFIVMSKKHRLTFSRMNIVVMLVFLVIQTGVYVASGGFHESVSGHDAALQASFARGVNSGKLVYKVRNPYNYGEYEHNFLGNMFNGCLEKLGACTE